MTEYQGTERRRGAPDRRTQSFERVKIQIVDDHALFRVGIRGILQQEPDLEIVAEAYPSKTIAQMLTISIKTVERHRANILEKLGMRDRVELTRYAIRRGLVEP